MIMYLYLPNTLRIFFRFNLQLFEVTPESYRPKVDSVISHYSIPYFHIIRDVKLFI